MIEVAIETEIARKINSLVQQAFDFGVSCSDDGISNMNHHGDSHIEFMRSKLNDAKDELYILMLKEVK